jgi:adenosylhomocysteine nucleosidase
VTGVLFALDREAAPFRRRVRGRADVLIRVSGVGRAAARAAAERLLDEAKPDLVIAAGFCGALSPGLRVGDVVTSPRIATTDRLVATPVGKSRLRAETGADAVDMESAAVEALCRERGVPFLAVRAVSDTADTALSPELVRLLSGGSASVPRAVAALLRRPALLGEFRRLGRDTAVAARALADVLVTQIAKKPNSRKDAKPQREQGLPDFSLRLCFFA